MGIGHTTFHKGFGRVIYMSITGFSISLVIEVFQLLSVLGGNMVRVVILMT